MARSWSSAGRGCRSERERRAPAARGPSQGAGAGGLRRDRPPASASPPGPGAQPGGRIRTGTDGGTVQEPRPCLRLTPKNSIKVRSTHFSPMEAQEESTGVKTD
ncbi:hypothetical protein NDU88_002942 [Pleurodeles waltl]|uniref:Uncharacterized protein n=1 Tax=Pleurodeles waltl TaxID=8319 RepID=A0AAV7TN79_PLEWA|nr:hypothetical protein NDU88_002942 [Pleurodeles waltl]